MHAQIYVYNVYIYFYIALVQEIFSLKIKTWPPHINKYNQDCPPQPFPNTHLPGAHIYSVKLNINSNSHSQ